MGRLAFSTSPCVLLIGSRLGHELLLGDVPVRAVQRTGFGPKAAPSGWTPLMGFIDRPFADTTVVCVHSRLSRRPDFGVGLPRPALVPLLPFLPASAVSSAEGGSEDPPFDCPQVCCTLQPAVGFTTFQASRSAFRLSATRRS